MSAGTLRLVEAGVAEIHAAYRTGALGARRLAQLYLERIDAYDQQGPELNAIISLNPHALAEAERLDAAYKASGPVGPLHGIPVIVKDQADVKGMATTLGSLVFKDFFPDRDCFVVEQLKKAGAFVLAKATLGLGKGLYPVPLLLTLVVGGLGWLFLTRTAPGRQVFAIGGNEVASLYSGVPVSRVLVLVYAISGLCAGIAAYLGASYYGSASSSDGQGYELLVIASAVVGGASLRGGKGSAVSALLGALLIALFRQAVRTLKFDQNYEQILIGCAIIVAVVLDRWSSRIGESRSTRSQ